MPITSETHLMSARQAAEYLKVSKAYVCRLFASGKIPAYRVDTDWIVEEKDLRSYLDDKSNIPIYYRDTSGWNRDNYYFLFRTLDHMINNRAHRYDKEIDEIDVGKLSAVACAMLVALRANEKYDSLGNLICSTPIIPPIILSDSPSLGQHPEFEAVGIIL